VAKAPSPCLENLIVLEIKTNKQTSDERASPNLNLSCTQPFIMHAESQHTRCPVLCVAACAQQTNALSSSHMHDLHIEKNGCVLLIVDKYLICACRVSHVRDKSPQATVLRTCPPVKTRRSYGGHATCNIIALCGLTSLWLMALPQSQSGETSLMTSVRNGALYPGAAAPLK
jgi:hypothetical protein